MRSVVYVGTSLDGFIARKDGDIAWLSKFESKEVFVSYGKFMKDIDAILIGRGTFETVLSFKSWPYEKPAFILSSQLRTVPDKFKEKVSILSLKPKEALEYLSRSGYSSVYVDGGKVIQSFLREDLIDELIITRLPILIGSGISLFGDLDHDLEFESDHTEVYSHGLVQTHYTRKRK